MTQLSAGARPFRGGRRRTVRRVLAPVLITCCLIASGCNAIADFSGFKFGSDAGVEPYSAPDGSLDSGPGPDSGSGCAAKELSCDDGVDNDCDGLEDCLDDDCTNDLSCCKPNEIPEVSCSDGFDNDCDGEVDCADSDCSASSDCCVASEAEVGNSACDDGVDNDCDGLVDCDEPSCAAQVVCCNATGPESDADACGDGVDNDCDGKRDCQDPDCAVVGACCSKSQDTETSCQDAQDNDCDGLADCRDPDCENESVCTSCVPAESTETNCQNKLDDDCDKDPDCFDDDCSGDPACCVSSGQEQGDTACVDGQDNDCDGDVDCADADCANVLGCCVASGPESGDVACSDGVDNDCDGKRDCDDPGCTEMQDCCVPLGAETGMLACNDGIDNDCDNLRDCDDPDCQLEPSCCVKTGAEADAPNDGKDNDCDGQIDIPQLKSSYPPMGQPAAGNDVSLSFVPSIVADAVLECSTRRASAMDPPKFDVCPGSGSTVTPHSATAAKDSANDGAWVTDVRWRFPSGAHSQVFTFRYYIHHTLYGVKKCAQTIPDGKWFELAASVLADPDAGAFDPAQPKDTNLVGPFVHVTYHPPNANDIQLYFEQDGTTQLVDMWSLRHRFLLSPDNRFLLVGRNYVSTHSGKCYAANFRVHNTMHTNPNGQLRYLCDVVVLNHAGAGVCLRNNNGTAEVAHTSTDALANKLGWTGANKFMWRQLVTQPGALNPDPKTRMGLGGDVRVDYKEREGRPYRNFMPKCSVQPCPNLQAIYLPDRALFP